MISRGELKAQFCLLMMLLPVLVTGQNARGVYTEVDVKKELNKKLGIGTEIEQRFDNVNSTFDRFIIAPSLFLNLSKSWRVGTIYRFVYKETGSGDNAWRQRLSIYGRKKIKVIGFDLKVKSVLQYSFKEGYELSIYVKNELVSRNSLELEYDIFNDKFTPGVKGELFYNINDPKVGKIEQRRVYVKLGYNFSRAGSLNIFYLFRQEVNVKSPEISRIFGVSYGVKI